MFVQRLQVFLKSAVARKVPSFQGSELKIRVENGIDRIVRNTQSFGIERQITPKLSILGFPDGIDSTHNETKELDWNGLLFAAPKRKTTPSKKKMRSRHKQLKPRTDLVGCDSCGKKHPRHHLCPFCHEFNQWTTGKDGGLDRLPVD
mmetsp:Transcript_7900/g.9058  ORF Transcript_7900/g.9058 Transcript_7900/m.9058 type:complete len:147 (-) Transcript_7900:886-1326(-)